MNTEARTHATASVHRASGGRSDANSETRGGSGGLVAQAASFADDAQAEVRILAMIRADIARVEPAHRFDPLPAETHVVPGEDVDRWHTAGVAKEIRRYLAPFADAAHRTLRVV